MVGLTLRAQDEVVNIRTGGHTRTLATLLDHPSRGNHLYVDHLSGGKTRQHVEMFVSITTVSQIGATERRGSSQIQDRMLSNTNISEPKAGLFLH